MNGINNCTLSLNLTCKHDVNETVQVTQVSRKEKIKSFTIQQISRQISDHSSKRRKSFQVLIGAFPNVILSTINNNLKIPQTFAESSR